MKRMLFCLILLLEMVVVFAQEEQMASVNQSLYEQAIKALEERRFIIKFHTMDYRGQKRKQLNNETNFLILEGDSVSYQYDDGQREYLNMDGTTVSYNIPEIERGKATDVKLKKNDTDNYSLSMSVKVKGTKGTPTKFKIKIVLVDKAENCIATIKDYWGNQYYTATLYPIDATTVMKAN